MQTDGLVCLNLMVSKNNKQPLVPQKIFANSKNVMPPSKLDNSRDTVTYSKDNMKADSDAKSMTGRAKDKLKSLFQPTQGLLRGVGGTTEEALAKATDGIFDAKNLLESQNNKVNLLQAQAQQGDNEAVVATMKEISESLPLPSSN